MDRQIILQVCDHKKSSPYRWASLLTSPLSANQAGTLAGLAEKQDSPKHGIYVYIDTNPEYSRLYSQQMLANEKKRKRKKSRRKSPRF